MTADMGMNIPAVLNKNNIVIGFIIIFLTYELMKYINRRKILVISMADSLKSRME
jgi:hypothetical protein